VKAGRLPTLLASIFWLVSAAAVAATAPSTAVPLAQKGADTRPTIGLVLGGGGARGAAHVGVIGVLEEAGVRPDFIVGTSMGAIVGGLYAAGLDAAALQRVLENMDWDRMFADDPGRRDRTMRRKQLDRDFVVPRRLGFSRRGLTAPLGVLQGQHFDTALKRIVGQTVTVQDFDQLPIPFRAVATDITTGEPVILGSGSLVQAIRASMSVPGVFAPVLVEDRLLVDGGLAMNIPVQVAREMGADVLIVVDLSQPLLGREAIDSILKVTDQLGNFLTRRNSQESLALLAAGDVLIQPDLGDINAVQFERALEASARGAATAARHVDELRSLAGRNGAGPRGPLPQAASARLDFIDLVNGSTLEDQILLNRLTLKPGDPLDLDRLEADLDAIYALDVFDAVRYDIVRDQERGTGVIVNAQPRTWGPNYLQFGLTLATDFDAVTDFSMGLAYTRNAINRLGADLRISAAMGRYAGVETDWHQPLDHRGAWFVHPGIFWARDRRYLYEDARNIGEVDIDRWGVRLGAGRNFGPRAQLRGDYLWARESAGVSSGIAPESVLGGRRVGELSASARYDSLNHIHFPTRGSLLELTARDSRLDSSIDYQQLELTSTTAWTSGRWSLLTRSLVGISSDDAIPLQGRYRLGGFGRLSGLPPDALQDRHAALLAVSGQRRIADLRLLPIYAGASLETGNTWNERSDISLQDLRTAGSVFLGVDSFLGPWYLAFGLDDDGNSSFYFHLGNPFELRRR
jgi:NTE family protein